MLDVDDFYKNTYSGKYNAPEFSYIVKRCNEWLIEHNYTPVTESDVKNKLKYNSADFFAFPYGNIYHIISVLVQSNKNHFEETFETFIKNIDYVPQDNGIKAGEETVVDFRFSKESNVLYAPNDYALTNRQIKEFTK